MDQKRIGSFLRVLRTEQQLTQEQLAEALHVTARTVSRWETGSNMPDISTLVELAEFYQVSIPEIIDGERKREAMEAEAKEAEAKETALKLSDYAEAINQRIRHRLFWLTIAALVGIAVCSAIELAGLDTPGSIYESVASFGLGLDLGFLIVTALYFSGTLGRIKARRMLHRSSQR